RIHRPAMGVLSRFVRERLGQGTMAQRSQGVTERARAAVARTRAGILRTQARALREQSEQASLRLMNDLRRTEGPSLGEHGDTFSLRLGRMIPAGGFAPHHLLPLLRARGGAAEG